MKWKIRAVLFDLDGTLADTLADLANATNQALAQLGCPTHPVEAYRCFVGDGAHNLLLRVLPPGQRDRVEEGVRLMREYYEAHCFDLTRLYPGVSELVAALQKRACPLAVLSNKPHDFTKRVVAHYFQTSPFAIVKGQLPDIPLKPDPTAALRIANELGVPPGEWLYLGDTNTDMRTARAAGMRAVGVLWGFRGREELLESGAEALVARPDEILHLVAWS
ncbi:MAG: HAD family hydrolase [Verrucomicrobiae bacterium]|nr:HAD family hydrolase [Verrucomicrobiae bacterium]